MPTTSNFGWTTPADTDLVKDGAAAIRTLGNGVDTSLVDLKGGTTGQILSKNSNTDLDYTWVTPNVGDITEVQAGTGISVASGTGPIPVVTNTVATAFDAAGDLVYGTGADTFTKLSLGTAGQVLKVNSGATAPEWAAASSGLTLIKRASYSNVANTGTTFDSVFTSTYRGFLVNIESNFAATGTDDFQILFRYGGTSQTTAYFSSSMALNTGSTATNTVVSNGTASTIHYDSGDSSYPLSATFFINQIGNGSSKPYMAGQGYAANGTPVLFNFGAFNDGSRSYDGFLLKSSSTNITGTVSVYGLAI